MTALTAVVLIVALFAAPAGVLAGAAAGVLMTWRIMRGLPPVQLPQRREKQPEAKPADKPKSRPRVET